MHNQSPYQSSTDVSTRLYAKLVHFYKRNIRPRLNKKNLKRVILTGIALAIIFPVGTYAYFARDIQDRDRLMNRNNTGIILKDRNGETFYSSGLLSTRDDVPLSEISDNVENALIASEDKDFYKHHGFSVRGTGRALVNNVLNRDATASGGSTITQQLVKNKLLSSDKNYLRKYQEVAMSIAVERRYSKDEILDMYLNSAYFGEGAFGINDAAQTYFAKDAKDLSLAESTMLVGLLPAPSSYSPVSGSAKLAAESQRNVLRKMVIEGKITEQQRDEVLNTQLAYSDEAKKAGAEYAQHFADMVVKELEQQYGEEVVKRSGFTVTTTLDLSKQKTAEDIIRSQVAKTASRGGTNSGLVSIDPRSGEVIALVGSVDYYNKEFGQVNMATALRQPGSSFKPIYFSDAIDRELVTANTTLDDKKMTFGGTYSPKNYDNAYKGKMPLRNALAQSRNIPAVEVMQKEGVTNAVEAANRMGISSVDEPNKYGLSLALGTAEVRLMQMTSAYGAFANKGNLYKPITYTKVVDKYNKTIAENRIERPRAVLKPDTAYIMSSILSDTSARAPTFGSSLNISGRTVALKTGTTNDNKDAWTIGYTPSLVTGVWLGNNANQPMRGLAGGSGAGSTWKLAMEQFLKGSKRESFTRPNGVVEVQVCSDTGNRSEFFIRGTEPSDTCKQKEEEKPAEEKPNDDKKEEPKKPEDDTTTNPGNGGTTGPGSNSGNGGSTTGPGTGTGTGGSGGTGGTTGPGGGTTTPPSPGGTTTPRQ
jgi:1A family penicillin-binding protein